MGQYQYSAAYEVFQELHRQRPDDLELAVDTAIARLNMAGDADIQFASELLNRVLTRDPEHRRANFTLGVLKIYQGPPADPRENFRRVAQADSGDPDAAYLYAQSLEQARDLAAARSEYLRCLELNEYYASALLGLSRLARLESDPSAAAEWIRQFEERKANPNSRIFEFVYKRMGRYAEVSGPAISPVPNRPLPPGPLFQDPLLLADLPGPPADLESACLVTADLNGDQTLDLVVTPLTAADPSTSMAILLGTSTGGFEPTDSIPWSRTADVNAVLCGDLDEDGRIDVYLCRRGPNQLWLQPQSGNWVQAADPVVAASDSETTGGLLFDADHDGDLDILCLQRTAAPQLLNNNRDGSFRPLDAASGFDPDLRGAKQVVAADFDNDRDVDLYFVSEQSSVLLWNERQWKYRQDRTGPEELYQAGPALGVDWDHDGCIDLVKLQPERCSVISRNGPAGWRLLQLDVSNSGRVLELGDWDGDLAWDLLVLTAESLAILDHSGKHRETLLGSSPPAAWLQLAGPHPGGAELVILSRDGKLWRYPPGAGRFGQVRLQFSGKQDAARTMRSNRSGIGTRWKARVGDRWVTGLNFPAGTGRGQSVQPSWLGTAGADRIDLIAIDWSDGVFQTELGLKLEGLQRIEETQRQLASCPLVFAWDGNQFGFVSDVLGVGGIGFLAAPGEYAPPRPWENLQLSATQLQPHQGRLMIKLGEPMEEACYLLQADLDVVELPSGWELIVDERAGVTDPQPTGDYHYFRVAYEIQAAANPSGTQTEALRQADRVAADVGELDERFIGLLSDEHVLEFDFGPLPRPREKRALAIDGWIEYPYSQTVFAAAQAGKRYTSPSLDIRTEAGDWETVWSELGFPAGMPRSMLIPLPEAAQSATHFRLRTNQQIYWDRIRLVDLEACPTARIEPQPLERAELRRVGFARRSTGPQFRPDYDYSRRSGTWDARHLPGFYSGFGDVLGQLDGLAPVVFGPGEEVHLEFNAALPEGLDRSRCCYVLRLRGGCKDLDLLTGDGDELSPIPLPGGELRSKAREAALNRYWRYESGPWYARPFSDPVSPSNQ